LKRSDKRQTTLGELIVALTDEIGSQIRDRRKTHAAVAFILAALFKQRLARTCEQRY
jgi:hypothetical protein